MSRSSPTLAQSTKADSPPSSLCQTRGKNTRTQIACDACKKRRTKCSGMPGPCAACTSSSSYCHFHPRMDSRRKECMKSSDHARERRQIMCALLLALRHNPEEDIQELLRVIRSPKLSAPLLARTVQKHMQIVSDRTGLSASRLSEDDILSLALADMLSHKPNIMDLRQSKSEYGNDSFSFANSNSTDLADSRAQEWLNNQGNQSWSQVDMQLPLGTWDSEGESQTSSISQSYTDALNPFIMSAYDTFSKPYGTIDKYALNMDHGGVSLRLN